MRNSNNNTPPRNDQGQRIYEPQLRVSVSAFHSNKATVQHGDPVPTYGGITLRFEEEASHRVVMGMEMSVLQWMNLVETAMTNRASWSDGPRATMTMSPVDTELREVEDKEPPYHKLAEDVREGINKVVAQLSEAVDELEALHSEKAGRVKMGEGIRDCRSSIANASRNIAYANDQLESHVQRCLSLMLVDERFSAAMRDDG